MTFLINPATYGAFARWVGSLKLDAVTPYLVSIFSWLRSERMVLVLWLIQTPRLLATGLSLGLPRETGIGAAIY